MDSIVEIHQQAREFATKAISVGLTLRNWPIGYPIVEFEQKGADRAACGENLLGTLSQRLAAKGFLRVTSRELRRFGQFYQTNPNIWESLAPESGKKLNKGE